MHAKNGSTASAALEAVRQLRQEWIGTFKRCGDGHKATRHAYNCLRRAKRLYAKARHAAEERASR